MAAVRPVVGLVSLVPTTLPASAVQLATILALLTRVRSVVALLVIHQLTVLAVLETSILV